MTRYDYLIIGGGIAGVTAAETIRARDPRGSIAIVGDEPHILYSRVLLPAYLKGKIRREQLFLRRSEDFSEKQIDVLLGARVAGVDPARKEVAFADRDPIAYQKLLIASGGRVKPWGKGKDEDVVFRLQTLDDADRLWGALPRMKRALVVGSSFIGLEFLEIFNAHRVATTILSRDAYYFSSLLDPRGGEMLGQNFERFGVAMQFGDEVAELGRSESGIMVTTKAMRNFETDALAIGVGIDRNVEVFRDSGIAGGAQGILANEFLETNQPDVWAAGDGAEFRDVISGDQHVLGNWTSAFLQGKRAGENMAGTRDAFRHVPSYSITNFGFQITALGETLADTDTIVRIAPLQNQYERLFLKDGALAGAALINRFHDKPHLVKLIEGRVNLAAYREKLQDPSFDIHEIPLVQ